MVLADTEWTQQWVGSDTEEYSFAEHSAQKSGHCKAQNRLDSLQPWSILHTHPSLPGQSCTDSSAPKVTALVNWKKAAHLQRRPTEQSTSLWRDCARVFVTLALSLRSTSLLWQLEVMMSPGRRICLWWASYQTGKSEGLVPALKKAS